MSSRARPRTAPALESLEPRTLLSNTYYVADPRGPDGVAGTADDVSAADTNIGTFAQPFATLARAASMAQPGDTVFIRGGVYNETLIPASSGAPGAPITYRNYGTEAVTITGELERGIDLSGRNYVTIEGLNIVGVHRWLYALDSHYDVLANNRFIRATDEYGSSKTGLFFQEATYNRIVGNTIEDSTADNLSLIMSDHNLIERNTIRKAAHTLWCIKGGNFNVVRNNYFHNERQKCGEIFDAFQVGFDHQFSKSDCTRHNLVEGNSFALTGNSKGASPFAGIQYAGQRGLIRNNLFYDTIGPGLDLTLYDDEAMYNTDNRVCHNVFFHSSFAGVSLAGSGGYSFWGNLLKNNILARSSFVANDKRWKWYTRDLDGHPVQIMIGNAAGFVFDANAFCGQKVGEGSGYLITQGRRDADNNPGPRKLAWWQRDYPREFRNNIEADPMFVDEAKHDFHLRPGSPMIDAGTFLTRTAAAGQGTVMKVQDAGWFYDGYGIEGEQGDLIQLEGQAAPARIVKIDYDANTLTLDRSATWAANQGVSRPYAGKAPDIGAFEFQPATQPARP